MENEEKKDWHVMEDSSLDTSEACEMRRVIHPGFVPNLTRSISEICLYAFSVFIAMKINGVFNFLFFEVWNLDKHWYTGFTVVLLTAVLIKMLLRCRQDVGRLWLFVRAAGHIMGFATKGVVFKGLIATDAAKDQGLVWLVFFVSLCAGGLLNLIMRRLLHVKNPKDESKITKEFVEQKVRVNSAMNEIALDGIVIMIGATLYVALFSTAHPHSVVALLHEEEVCAHETGEDVGDAEPEQMDPEALISKICITVGLVLLVPVVSFMWLQIAKPALKRQYKHQPDEMHKCVVLVARAVNWLASIFIRSSYFCLSFSLAFIAFGESHNLAQISISGAVVFVGAVGLDTLTGTLPRYLICRSTCARAVLESLRPVVKMACAASVGLVFEQMVACVTTELHINDAVENVVLNLVYIVLFKVVTWGCGKRITEEHEAEVVEAIREHEHEMQNEEGYVSPSYEVLSSRETSRNKHQTDETASRSLDLSEVFKLRRALASGSSSPSDDTISRSVEISHDPSNP